MVAGITRIGIKAFVESVRLQTLNRQGLQQLQVDVHFLRPQLRRSGPEHSLIFKGCHVGARMCRRVYGVLFEERQLLHILLRGRLFSSVLICGCCHLWVLSKVGGVTLFFSVVACMVHGE